MSSEENDEQRDEQRDETPTTAELEEPSTEKEPDEEPTGGSADAAANHEAVGIGVIGSSVPEGSDSEDAHADDDLPTDAVTDEVRRASSETE